MSESRSAQGPASEGEALVSQASPRKAYERPQLTEFGSVKELTRSGSGAGLEPRTARKSRA